MTGGASGVGTRTTPAGVAQHMMGAVVQATDPRTLVSVLGRVDSVEGPWVRVEPLGELYPPGPFWARASRLRVFRLDGEAPTEDEHSARLRWDVVCMAMAGAMDKLNDDTVGLVSELINGGHV